MTITPVLKDFLGKLNAIVSNRWLRIVGQVLAVGFCLYYIITNWSNLYTTLQQTHFTIVPIILGALLIFFTVLLGAFNWWLLLFCFEQRISIQDAIYIHLQSSLIKYIPGYAWQYISKGTLTYQKGIPAGTVGKAMVIELLYIVVTGVGIGLLLFPAAIAPWEDMPATILFIGRGVGLTILLLPFLLVLTKPEWLKRLLGIKTMQRLWGLAASSWTVVIGWLFLGEAVILFVSGFGYPDTGTLLYFTFAFTVSMITGLLIILVPNGLGIREGLLAYLLSSYVPLAVAVLISSIIRLAISLGEIIGLLFVQIIRYYRNRPATR